jgi:hypothetical protein
MTCPLCTTVLKESDKETTLKPSKFPPYKSSDAVKRNFVLRLLLFISIVVGGVSFLINMLLLETGLWSLIVISGIIYLWILIKYTIMTNYNISLRLLFQAITVTLLVFAIERFIPSLTLAPIGTRWALEYVMPFVMIATSLAITIIIFVRPLKYRDYVFYLFCMSILGFIPIILYLFKLIEPHGFIPSLICAAYSVITLLGMFFFGDRTTKDELVKRFHI